MANGGMRIFSRATGAGVQKGKYNGSDTAACLNWKVTKVCADMCSKVIVPPWYFKVRIGLGQLHRDQAAVRLLDGFESDVRTAR